MLSGKNYTVEEAEPDGADSELPGLALSELHVHHRHYQSDQWARFDLLPDLFHRVGFSSSGAAARAACDGLLLLGGGLALGRRRVTLRCQAKEKARGKLKPVISPFP